MNNNYISKRVHTYQDMLRYAEAKLLGKYLHMEDNDETPAWIESAIHDYAVQIATRWFSLRVSAGLVKA